jgi:RNA polymerase sigma-70 factor (ECF subfamily)
MLRKQTLRSPLVNNPAASALADGEEAVAWQSEADRFIQIYRDQLPAVYRYLLARLGNRQDAEDVTSLVFERVWASLPRYRPTASFKSWLFTIAQRALVDYYRRHRPSIVPLDDLAETLADPNLGPEERALLAQKTQQVLRVLATMGREQQDVISLRFVAELSYGEIAQVMGKRESAVKMMAYRTLDELRKQCEVDQSG